MQEHGPHHSPRGPIVERGSSEARLLFPVEPVALRDLAQRAGLGFSDVVALTEIPSTTLNRLWKDPSWVTRSTGATLQLLLDVVPALSVYVEGRGFTSRVEQHLRVLATSGVSVRLPARVDGPDVAALSNALGVAAAVVNGHAADLRRRLALGWSLGHDRFIDAVFATGPDALAEAGGTMLVDACGMWLAEQPSTTSVADMVGHGVLAHKIAKYGAADTGATEGPPRDIRAAFVRRSLTIGAVLRDDDLDVVHRYHHEVQANPTVVRNEGWSLLTFDSGQRLPADFSLPAVTPRIYAALVHDAATLNDAYLGYLITTALPTLAAIQPPSPAMRSRLATVFKERLSAGIEDPRLRDDAGALYRRLKG
ncbi:Uncharacterised protein [Nocardia brasiliensis]|nr:Uncharacterised protein [Nocardia brasiliensis]